MVSAPAFRPIATHLFLAGDPYLDSDAVFGVKESLVVAPLRSADPDRARGLGTSAPFWEIAYDFALARA